MTPAAVWFSKPLDELSTDELLQAAVDPQFYHRAEARALIEVRQKQEKANVELREKKWLKEIRREWSHKGHLPKAAGEIDGRTVKNSTKTAAKWGVGTLLAGKAMDVAGRLMDKAIDGITLADVSMAVFSMPPWFLGLLGIAAGIGLAIGSLVLLQKKGMKF